MAHPSTFSIRDHFILTSGVQRDASPDEEPFTVSMIEHKASAPTTPMVLSQRVVYGFGLIPSRPGALSAEDLAALEPTLQSTPEDQRGFATRHVQWSVETSVGNP